MAWWLGVFACFFFLSFQRKKRVINDVAFWRDSIWNQSSVFDCLVIAVRYVCEYVFCCFNGASPALQLLPGLSSFRLFVDPWCLQLTTWGGGSFSNSFMLLTLGFLHLRVVHEFLILSPPKHRLQRARAGGPVPIKDGCVLDHLGRVRQVWWRTLVVEPATFSF